MVNWMAAQWHWREQEAEAEVGWGQGREVEDIVAVFWGSGFSFKGMDEWMEWV